jgi:hypothetical protein
MLHAALLAALLACAGCGDDGPGLGTLAFGLVTWFLGIQEAWARSPESGIADPAVVVADPTDLVGERFVPTLPGGKRAKQSGPFVSVVSRAHLADLLRETNDHGEDVDALMASCSRECLFLVCVAHMGSTAGEVVIVDGRLQWGRPKGSKAPTAAAAMN